MRKGQKKPSPPQQEAAPHLLALIAFLAYLHLERITIGHNQEW